ncbi:MAG: DUF6265 family protein [Planctomycetota bacterium]|jgi:predicted enzyme related to lactoylglutathione lyase
MRFRSRLAPTLVLLAILGAHSTASGSHARSTQADGLRALDGQWLYVEDRTEGRAVEDQQPPMGPQFGLRVEEDAVFLVFSRREDRIALDGSITEVVGDGATKRHRGEWKDGTLYYDVETVSHADGTLLSVSRREFRVTPDGLLVRVVFGDPPVMDQVALFRHPQDIALPEPAKAEIGDVAWIAGDWVGTRGKSSIEERWSPPRGGAMLGVSRTVRPDKDQMRAFEFLRVVERDGGLVYVAQPNGRTPTEFVLTELGPRRAVFVNPRHDFPQRIIYERSADGGLTASIGMARGGRPRGFEFRPEQEGRSDTLVHHVEIVSSDVDAQCAALERLHGLSFGPAVADLGGARMAESTDGSGIGVRAPLAAHEAPIVRTYLAVDDIAKAVREAEEAGAVIAYPPTKQGDTGTWAIYILGDVQVGLWQR